MSKVLMVVPALMPTVDIIHKSLECLSPEYAIEIVPVNKLDPADLCRGDYKILFIRLCDPPLSFVLNWMVQNKLPYLYYLDDNFWELKGNTPLALYHSHPDVLKTLNTFVQNAACVITGSENLRKYVSQYNLNTVTIKAGFDFNLIENVQQKPKNDRIVRILYAGSSYREKDFEFVSPALLQILDEFKEGVEIYFYGFIPELLKNKPQVFYDPKTYSYSEFIKMQYAGNFDIGLAPLHSSLSSQAKTDLKYREYGACHIAGIYSGIAPYTDCIVHKKNGILIDNAPNDWYSGLKKLITDTKLRQSIANTASLEVRKKYHHKEIANEWKSVFNTYMEQALQNYALRIRWHKKISLRMGNRFKSVLFLYYKVKYYHQYHGFTSTCKKILGRFKF